MKQVSEQRNKEVPVDSVTTIISQVMQDVRAVGKAEKHGQGWSFRGVDAVVNALAPACRARGLVVLPQVVSHEADWLPAANGKQMRSVVVTVKYVFTGPAGDCVEVVSVGEAFDHGDKATAKAMSVAFRTALLQAFMLPTDEPDPDHDVYEVAAGAPVSEFVPGNPDSWPEMLSQAQAKKAVLFAAGGDKGQAQALWEEYGSWQDWPADLLLTSLPFKDWK